MSTRCRIGIKNQDGTITSIYCHHDGYVDGVGEVLVNHYKDEAKIRKLMELGDMSSIGTEPIDNPRAWQTPKFDFSVGGKSWAEQWKEINPDNMCNTYKSRGEDCPASIDKSLKAYQKHSKDNWGEFTYLFQDNKWYVSEDDDELKLVENLL